jgi:hypothetical protein
VTLEFGAEGFVSNDPSPTTHQKKAEEGCADSNGQPDDHEQPREVQGWHRSAAKGNPLVGFRRC